MEQLEQYIECSVLAEILSNKVTMTKTRQRIVTGYIKKYCPEGNISQYTPKGAGREL